LDPLTGNPIGRSVATPLADLSESRFIKHKLNNEIRNPNIEIRNKFQIQIFTAMPWISHFGY